jgi:hypothetical protein
VTKISYHDTKNLYEILAALEAKAMSCRAEHNSPD